MSEDGGAEGSFVLIRRYTKGYVDSERKKVINEQFNENTQHVILWKNGRNCVAEHNFNKEIARWSPFHATDNDIEFDVFDCHSHSIIMSFDTYSKDRGQIRVNTVVTVRFEIDSIILADGFIKDVSFNMDGPICIDFTIDDLKRLLLRLLTKDISNFFSVFTLKEIYEHTQAVMYKLCTVLTDSNRDYWESYRALIITFDKANLDVEHSVKLEDHEEMLRIAMQKAEMGESNYRSEMDLQDVIHESRLQELKA